MASTLFMYYLKKGDLFLMGWARVQQVRLGRISSELLMGGRGGCNILVLLLVGRCLETIDVCIWNRVVFMSVVVIVWECLLCSGHC